MQDHVGPDVTGQIQRVRQAESHLVSARVDILDLGLEICTESSSPSEMAVENHCQASRVENISDPVLDDERTP